MVYSKNYDALGSYDLHQQLLQELWRMSDTAGVFPTRPMLCILLLKCRVQPQNLGSPINIGLLNQQNWGFET
jgi:hypothetical protein